MSSNHYDNFVAYSNYMESDTVPRYILEIKGTIAWKYYSFINIWTAQIIDRSGLWASYYNNYVNRPTYNILPLPDNTSIMEATWHHAMHQGDD
jgi:hypothetical protein